MSDEIEIDEDEQAMLDALDASGTDLLANTAGGAGAEPEGADDPGGEPESESQGLARDEKGRFVAKEETEDDPAAGEAAKPGETPSGPAPTATATPETPAEPPPVAYTLRVGGQEYPIAGAQVTPGKGLFIPEASLPAASRIMQEGIYKLQHWKGELDTAEQKGFQRALAEAPEIVQSRTILAELEKLLDPANREQLYDFLQNLHQQGPILKERARAAALEARLQQLQSRESTQAEEAKSQQLEREKEQAWTETLSEFKLAPQFSGLTPGDWTIVHDTLADMKAALFVKDQDGDLALNVPAMERVVMRHLAFVSEERKAKAAADKAATFNRGVNGAKKPQPTRPAQRPQSAGAKGAKGTTPDKAGFDRQAFMRWNPLDEDDED